MLFRSVEWCLDALKDLQSRRAQEHKIHDLERKVQGLEEALSTLSLQTSAKPPITPAFDSRQFMPPPNTSCESEKQPGAVNTSLSPRG